VRLRSDEVSALREVMRALNLSSTSDALREGLRLLAREAAEVTAAEEIRAFYTGEPAPLPEAVPAPTDDELAVADNAQW
jgi:Arc/MetJ-type ribon-helix-helix transcriptional regulator